MARVKRTTINLDRDLVDEASEALGTPRLVETVHAAMADVVRRQKLRQLAEQDFPDLSLEKIKELRRPRSFDHLRE